MRKALALDPLVLADLSGFSFHSHPSNTHTYPSFIKALSIPSTAQLVAHGKHPCHTRQRSWLSVFLNAPRVQGTMDMQLCGCIAVCYLNGIPARSTPLMFPKATDLEMQISCADSALHPPPPGPCLFSKHGHLTPRKSCCLLFQSEATTP